LKAGHDNHLHHSEPIFFERWNNPRVSSRMVY